jgi:hypothetical protein
MVPLQEVAASESRPLVRAIMPGYLNQHGTKPHGSARKTEDSH